MGPGLRSVLINAKVSNGHGEAIPAQILKFNGTGTVMKHTEEKGPLEITSTLTMTIMITHKHILDTSDITGGQPFLLLCRCAERELHGSLDIACQAFKDES
jgi:hypothetical protein